MLPKIILYTPTQDNAIKGDVYIPVIDDTWDYICIIEDGIYEFNWDTKGIDNCWLCKRVTNLRCGNIPKGCTFNNIAESFIDGFEKKIITRHKKYLKLNKGK